MILHEIRYDRGTDTVQLLYKEFPGSTVYRVFSYDGKMAQRFRDVVEFTMAAVGGEPVGDKVSIKRPDFNA